MNPDQIVGSCDSSTIGPPLVANNNAAEEVFSNTVLWRIIGSYLNVGDLKACRLVNSGFHAMVIKETNFLQRCLVSLKPEQISRNIFGSTSVLWKNVLLMFQSPGEEIPPWDFSDQHLNHLDWLYPIISNVESLRLRVRKGSKGGNLFPLLKRLLLAPKKLRSLAMEPIFLIFGTTGEFEELEEILKNLDEFEILQPPPTWLFNIDGWANIDPALVSPEFVRHLKHLRVVKSYYPQKGVSMLSTVTCDEECQILTSVLTRIAMISSKTLKYVTLRQTRLWMGNQFFPSVNLSQPGAVTEFFEALPMIQWLDISVRSHAFPMEILNVIDERSDRLRKVALAGSNFRDTKWEFLEKTKLEEFQLGLIDSGNQSTLPSQVLNYLPSTIRRIFLRGPLESNPVAALKRLNPTLVTELTFIDSGNCFGDDTIKNICIKFGMLRKLNVTNAERVTDAGFIGSSSGAGSLSGIKGLRTLILRKCGSITDATLREIRFLELCYLDLAYNSKLTEEGFESVLSNNPSLETLLTSCKNVHHKRKRLCASHPRLSSIIYRELKATKKVY